MNRRELLQRAGGILGFAAVGGVASAADGDADPRPSPIGGSQPDENVPTVETGALGQDPFDERSEVPTGHWIVHDNSWNLGLDGDRTREHAEYFANNTTQHYIIDGETFVYDSFDDWDYSQGSDGSHRISIEYVTPPKRRGKTYEVRWEFEADVDDPRLTRWEDVFPFRNRVEVVGSR